MEAVYISHTKKDLSSIIQPVPKSKWREDLASSLKKELNLPAGTFLVFTGHQPILYHPGIFTKLIVASLVARHYSGKAYYLVLDTDKHPVEWKFIRKHNDTFYQDTISLSNTKEVLLNQQFPRQKKEHLLEILENWRMEIYAIFEPTAVPVIKDALEVIEETIRKKNFTIPEFSTLINSYLLEKLGIEVSPIFLSTITATRTYKYLIEFIKKNHKDFIQIYNSLLHDFRKEHNIKNPRQPFSNLREYELPFWKSDGKIRDTLTIYDDIEKIPYIFPKAICLSLIVRMFLGDIMIHGLGGGFYDKATERILSEFFKEPLSPFLVATSTFYIRPKASIPLESAPKEEITRKLRKWEFNPELYVDSGCSLKQEKLFLIHLKNYFDSKYNKMKRNYVYDPEILKNPPSPEYLEMLGDLEKNPEKYAKTIHEKILLINHKLHLYTLKTKHKLKQLHAKSVIAEKNRTIFFDRTYPVFYYDYFSLEKKVRERFTKDC